MEPNMLWWGLGLKLMCGVHHLELQCFSRTRFHWISLFLFLPKLSSFVFLSIYFFEHPLFLVCKLLSPLAHYIFGGYFFLSLPFVLELLNNVLKSSWLTLCSWSKVLLGLNNLNFKKNKELGDRWHYCNLLCLTIMHEIC